MPWFLSFTQNVWMARHSEWSTWLSQTWSLAVEEQFYLMLPMLVLLTPRRILPLALIGLISCAPALRLMIYLMSPLKTAVMSNYVLLPCRADALLLGVLAAWAIRQPHISLWFIQYRPKLYAGFCGLLSIAGLAVFRGWSYDSTFMITGGFTILAAFYTIFLLIAVTETNGPIKWLTSVAPLRQLGIVAYGIYLIHEVVPHFIFKGLGISSHFETPMASLTFAASLVSVGLLAWISWRYFEAPFISIGHRFKYDPSGSPSSPI
jgi:peptidoglycan/LPS O-acetylase OafA/YrhL